MFCFGVNSPNKMSKKFQFIFFLFHLFLFTSKNVPGSVVSYAFSSTNNRIIKEQKTIESVALQKQQLNCYQLLYYLRYNHL